MNTISDTDAEKALDFLRDTAVMTAQARADRIYCEEYRKSLKAQIMKEQISNEKEPSAAIQERNAYADPRYIAHLNGLKAAVFNEQKALFLREAAGAKLEAWRTMSANHRGMGK